MNNNYNNTSIPPRPPMGRGQKIAAIILGIFAVAVIGMWFAQFRKNILSPLKAGTGEKNIASTQDENSDEALRAKDSDNDGLSDWDEQNLYKTSPYIEDTDSDGILDKAEIDAGKDPNCPEGKDCYSASPAENKDSSPPSQNNGNNLPQDLTGQLNQLNIDNGGSTDAEKEKLLKGETDVASLRKLLLESGMDKTMLDKLSDEDLMKGYKETFNSVNK